LELLVWLAGIAGPPDIPPEAELEMKVARMLFP